MSEQKNFGALAISAVVAGVVGLFFVGSQQSAKNQQNNIDDLPAMRQQIATLSSNHRSLEANFVTLRESIADLQKSQAQQLDRDALNDAFQSLRDALSALEGQLNRRIQLEVKEPIFRQITSIKEQISGVDEDAEDNENKIIMITGEIQKLMGMLQEGNLHSHEADK